MLNKKNILKINLIIMFAMLVCILPTKVFAEEGASKYLYAQIKNWYKDEAELQYDVNLPFDAKLSFEFVYTDANLKIPEINFEKAIEAKKVNENEILETSIIPKDTKCTISIKNSTQHSDWWVNGCIYIIPTSDVRISDLKIKEIKNKVSVGDTITLEPQYSLDFIPKEEGEWKSSNRRIVDIDQNGEITANSMGTAVVTYSLYGKNANQRISISQMNVNMWKNEKVALKPFVKNLSNYKKGKWKSTNKKIVSVDKNGKITLKKAGKAKINFMIGNKKYVFNIFSYDGVKVYNIAYGDIYDRLKNPSSYILNDVRCEYDPRFYSQIYLTIDYSAMNSFGGYARGEYYCRAKNMNYYGDFVD